MIDLGTEDVIDSRVGVHDIHQFEVKLDYAIDATRRNNRYRIDTFFFVPYSLGVGPQSYSRDQFYADMQAYIRFKTPEMSLDHLLDPQSELSPFARIERLAGAPTEAHDAGALGDGALVDVALADKLEHELLLLGCLVRSNLRDRVHQIRAAFAGHEAGGGEVLAPGGSRRFEVLRPADVSDVCELLVDEIDRVIDRLRKLRTRAHADGWSVRLLEVIDLTDEYVSVNAEIQLTVLIAQIDLETSLEGGFGQARAAMAARILAERQHRRDNGYAAVLHDEGDNEHFIYRRSFLKKVVMSVLFLKIRRQSESDKAAGLAAASTAALAMLVATGAALVAQARYGVNTLPFVVALVASYVVKDRIKEWLKHYLAGKLAPWIADYAVDIRDPSTDVAIGRCRETVTWLTAGRVPPDVWKLRHAGADGSLEIRTKAELVLHYRKQIKLRSEIIGDHHRRLHDINDIIRFDITPFLARADNPLKPTSRYLADEDRVVSLMLPKVHHLNLVFVLTALDSDKPPQLERVRVVFDKAGIKRVEVPQNGDAPARRAGHG